MLRLRSPTPSEKGRKEPTMQNTIYTLTQKSGKYNHNFDKTGTIFTFQGLFIACKKYLSILHICLFTFCAFEAFTLCNYPLLPNPLPAIQKYRPGRTGKTGNSNVWIIMARDPPVLLRLPPLLSTRRTLAWCKRQKDCGPGESQVRFVLPLDCLDDS